MKISIATAMSLTDLSENTFRRRIASGAIVRTMEEGTNGRSLISFDAIRRECYVPFREDELELIKNADGGTPEAQNDLALLFCHITDRRVRSTGLSLHLSNKIPMRCTGWGAATLKVKE